MSEKYIVSSNVSFCPQVKDITVTDGQDPEKDLEKKDGIREMFKFSFTQTN